MNCRKPGKGMFTAFLDKHEDTIPFMVESIMNMRLAKYLQRRDYMLFQAKGHAPTCISFALSPLARLNELAMSRYTDRLNGFDIVYDFVDLERYAMFATD